ncbi:ComE operon protein [Lentibacillus sp. JNUCC-1]|uniref:ComEC/Rec2 family competence protein n=1 Tax=Lentibacillus sp. JNUCC-1 TaxID=2654513 RepID=UPI0012E8C113|nr:ComEC/Rec2 family competence protein [Lentibacillus sp. JNUCC-1]MUV38683.1 ComE operon protein [Lentibacillus sp. JNUCC-1]
MKRIAVILIFTLTITAWPYHTQAQTPTSLLKVHFIDVGQGDSILIETPADKVILVDGGPPDAGPAVVDYLNKQQIDTIDLLVATHPDIDHIGGLVEVMKQFKIGHVLDNGKFHVTKTYLKYVHQIRRQMIPVYEAGEDDHIEFDPFLKMQILNADEETRTNNQSSIVLAIEYLQKSLLLAGDIDKDMEYQLMKAYDLKGDFLKIPHHGSDTSSTMAFIEAVHPKAAILSYARENKFGHPVERVMGNLQRMQIDLYSTAIHGNIVLMTDGKHHVIQTEKDPLDYVGDQNEAG